MQPGSPVVYPTGIQQSGLQRSKKGTVIGIGCGILLILGLCLVLAYYLTKEPSKKDIGETIGSVDVNQSGGVFAAEGITIYFPSVATGESAHYDIRRVDSNINESNEVEFQSSGYSIDGPLHLLEGEMGIVFEVPNDVSLDSSVVLVLEEQIYTPSYSQVTSLKVLPTLIDIATRRLQTSLNFQMNSYAMNQRVASIGFPSKRLQVAIPNSAITIRYEKGRFTDSLTSTHFRVDYHAQTVRPDLVEQAIVVMEGQRQSLLNLGFTFAGVNPIPVQITPLKNIAGQFVPSKLGAGYSSLELASRYFYLPSEYSSNLSDLTATIGHELMHFAQFAMNPDWAFTKAVNPINTNWMDEACATWYEGTQNTSKPIPQNAINKSGFVHHPLYGAPLEESREQGYGASFFVTYLVNQYGHDFCSDLYKNLVTASSLTAAETLQATLKVQGTTPSIEWVNFLEVYEISPGELSGYTGKDIHHRVGLEAGDLDASGNAKVSFNPGSSLQPYINTNQPGYLTGGENASFSVSFELAGLSAEDVLLTLKEGNAFNQPGQIVITVDAPAGAGVLVYGMMPNGVYVPLAGAPIYYLSYSDPMTIGGYRLLVDNFSLDGSPESYSRLLLVPFNNKSTSFTTGDPVARVTFNLWYWGQVLPLDFTPTAYLPIDGFGPTPTTPGIVTPDPGYSDHACAGMTLDKMRQPSVLNKRCWTACFGIGSSSPSDSEILDCIAKHQ